MVCLWDEKSHAKMYKALQDDILEFIKQAQTVSISKIILQNSGNEKF